MRAAIVGCLFLIGCNGITGWSVYPNVDAGDNDADSTATDTLSRDESADSRDTYDSDSLSLPDTSNLGSDTDSAIDAVPYCPPTAGGTQTGNTVTFSNGQAVGAMVGVGWVAGGSSGPNGTGTPFTTFTSPTCPPGDGTFVGGSNPGCLVVSDSATNGSDSEVDGNCFARMSATVWSTTDSLCISGTIPALESCPTNCGPSDSSMDYAEDWGAIVGINATNAPSGTVGNSFATIAVNYTGMPEGIVKLQVADTSGNIYCLDDYASGQIAFASDLVTNCWTTGGTPLPSIAAIAQVTLEIESTSTDVTFTNFCMTGITFGGTGLTTDTAPPPETETATDTATETLTPTTPFQSCQSLSQNCGTNGDEDCCTSILVPGGETFHVGPWTATVSTFALDKFDVTVGRFRQFVKSYVNNTLSGPPSGAGANPNVTGVNTGWDASWNTGSGQYGANLPASKSAFETALSTCGIYGTYSPTSSPGGDIMPISCVNWYEAFAFCIWDGGRLPTEAEWEYAAAGGDQDNLYPWGSTPAPTDSAPYYCTYASYDMACNGGMPSAVGFMKDDKGRWGHMDLAGNLYEWAFDWYSLSYTPDLYTNPAIATPGTMRVQRGGSFHDVAAAITTDDRAAFDPTAHGNDFGFRCARDVHPSDAGADSDADSAAEVDSVTDILDSPAGFAVAAGGYITSGVWQGYASPGGSAGFTPIDFSAVAAGGSLCVSSTVGSSDNASIAINIDQAVGASTLPNPVAVTGSGLSYTLSSTGAIVPDVVSLWDNKNWYSASISSLSGTIPWGSFSSSGTSFDLATDSVVSIEFVAINSGETSTQTNFCLTNLATAP